MSADYSHGWKEDLIAWRLLTLHCLMHLLDPTEFLTTMRAARTVSKDVATPAGGSPPPPLSVQEPAVQS